jgi:hypothetical protein
MVNLLEYALGLGPNTTDPDPLELAITANRLTVSYRRPHPAPVDVNYLAEVASTPAAAVWNSGPLYTTQTLLDNVDGTETVVVTDLTDLNSAPAHYVRIRVSR